MPKVFKRSQPTQIHQHNECRQLHSCVFWMWCRVCHSPSSCRARSASLDWWSSAQKQLEGNFMFRSIIFVYRMLLVSAWVGLNATLKVHVFQLHRFNYIQGNPCHFSHKNEMTIFVARDTVTKREEQTRSNFSHCTCITCRPRWHILVIGMW